MRLLTVNNPKTSKSVKVGYHTAVLHLAPHRAASRRTVCPWSTSGCRAACLNAAGRGGIHSEVARVADGMRVPDNAIQLARVRRTLYFHRDRAGFLSQLVVEVAAHIRRADRLGLRPAVRLNGTSDLPWETMSLRAPVRGKASIYSNLMLAFPDVQFYDYTKSLARALARKTRAYPALAGWLGVTHVPNVPANYHLTYSRGEDTPDATVRQLLTLGINVAVVYRGDNGLLGARFGAASRVDGDAHDCIFLHRPGSLIALRAKGPARADRTGFVIDV